MSLSQLDANQVIQSVYDDNGNLRTVLPASATVQLATSTVINIELDASDGDSVGVQGVMSSTSGIIGLGGSTGVLIGPLSCTGMKSFQIYSYTSASASTGAIGTLELSPLSSTATNVWYTTSLSVTSSTSASGVIASSIFTGLAQQARLKITQLPDASSATFYLVMQGN